MLHFEKLLTSQRPEFWTAKQISHPLMGKDSISTHFIKTFDYIISFVLVSSTFSSSLKIDAFSTKYVRQCITPQMQGTFSVIYLVLYWQILNESFLLLTVWCTSSSLGMLQSNFQVHSCLPLISFSGATFKWQAKKNV